MKVAQPVRFTKGEAAFLAHRLQMSDTLGDFIADSEDDALAAMGLDHHLVETECTQLCGQIEGGWRVDTIVSTALLSPLRTALLRDAVEGSTYVVCVDDDRPAERAAAARVSRSAAKKLRAAGFPVSDAPEV